MKKRKIKKEIKLIQDQILLLYKEIDKLKKSLLVAPNPNYKLGEVPHAEATKRLLKELSDITPEQARQMFIRSEILTPDGDLAPYYRDGGNNE